MYFRLRALLLAALKQCREACTSSRRPRNASLYYEIAESELRT